MEAFRSHYGISLEPAFLPADPLLARLYREFRRGSISVYPLGRVKSALAMGAACPRTKRRKLAEEIELNFAGNEQELLDSRLADPLIVRIAIEILVHGWGLAGTREWDSRPPTRPRR